MIPVLFPYTMSPADAFTFGSLGRLNDAITCEATEAYSDHSYQYTLEMEYPITGRLFDDLVTHNIILATPSLNTQPQAFRIKKVTRPLNGIVKIYAEHISYDLGGLPVYMTADATGAHNAIQAAKNTAGVTNPFYFSTDVPNTSTVMEHPDGPVTARELLLMDGGVQDTFGGEWLWNNGEVTLMQARGMDSGLVLRRGKNISDLEQDETMDESFSGIFPFWKGGDTYVVLPERVLTKQYALSDNIAIVDFSRYFKKKPTVANLRSKAQNYLDQKINANPTVSTSVDFVLLSQTLEHKELASVEDLHVYDVVHIVYSTLDINISAKVCKTVYNVLLDRYEAVEVGAVKQSVYRAVKKIAEKTTQASGGSVRQAASDEVVDTGTSGNWSYRHWASGKKEAWFNGSVSSGSTWTQSGNAYRATWSQSIPAAVGFDSTPHVLISIAQNTSAIYAITGYASSKTATSGYFFRGQSANSSSSVTISIYAWTD